MVERIDPSNCVRYILSEDIDSVCQKLISWLSDVYTEIFLIHQETHVDHNRVLTRLTLFHRHWGPTVIIEIFPADSTQTLILIALPSEPDLGDVSSYEAKILEHLPNSSASIRLARGDGNDERALALMSTTLRQQRHHCWMQIQSSTVNS